MKGKNSKLDLSNSDLQNNKTKLIRNHRIDMLRGISILLVIFHHMAIRIPLKNGVLSIFLPEWFVNTLCWSGNEAVFIFFVISGFLITVNSLVRWGKIGSINIKHFYLKRGARIIPCLVILVGVLSILHLLGLEDYVITRSDQSLSGAIFSALGFYLNWYEGQTSYLPGGWDILWSLSIEEVFYFVFPLICLAFRKDTYLAPLVLLFALALPITRAAITTNGIWQEKAYLPGMAGIAMGVFTALMVTRFRLKKQLPLSLLSFVGICGMGVVLFWENIIWPFMGNFTLLVLTISSAIFLAACYWQVIINLDNGTTNTKLIGTDWLCSFGRLSYEIYLTHMFVVFLVVHYFELNNVELYWGAFWYIPAIIVSWMLGWLVARYISIPCELIIRYYGEQLLSFPVLPYKFTENMLK